MKDNAAVVVRYVRIGVREELFDCRCSDRKV